MGAAEGLHVLDLRMQHAAQRRDAWESHGESDVRQSEAWRMRHGEEPITAGKGGSRELAGVHRGWCIVVEAWFGTPRKEKNRGSFCPNHGLPLGVR